MREAEMHLELIKEIKGNKILKVTRDDLTPENVGMIVAHSPNGKEAPFASVEEAEGFLSKYSL